MIKKYQVSLTFIGLAILFGINTYFASQQIRTEISSTAFVDLLILLGYEGIIQLAIFVFEHKVINKKKDK